MKDIDYTQAYLRMSDGELAQLVSEGRNSLNEAAIEALNRELEKRGLTDDLLAQEYQARKPIPRVQDAARRPRERLSIKDFRSLRPWQITVIGLALVATVAFTFFRQREARQDQLYWKVMTSIDTTESRAAFDELITYRGGHARYLVLRIATTSQPIFSFDSRQTEAIRFLGQTGDSETANQLALLLRPFRGLEVRDAAADSLLKLPCLADCIRSVLDYRERMWRGEPSVETMLGDRIPDEINEKRQEVDRKLNRVLLNHRRDTLTVLVKEYGIGEIPVPSFALYLTSQLKLTEACELLNIDQRIKATPDEQLLVPRMAEIRRQINTTRQQLNCEGSPLAIP